MNIQLDIVYVYYNKFEDLQKSISSLLKHNISFVGDVIVVNNNIGEDIETYFKSNKFSVKIINPKNNVGFAKANNIAASQTSRDYLCFINPDTIFIEDCITPLLEFMNQHNKSGVCGPMLVYGDLSYQNSTGFKMGLMYEFLEASMLISIIRKINELKFKNNKFTNKVVEVDWLSGAFMIVKKEIFNKVNGFTEDFFLNYEDIDLCWKIQKLGYSNYYFPEYKCVHLDHGSFEKNYGLLVFSRYQSRLVYAKLHYSLITELIVRIVHIFGIIARIIGSIFKFRGQEMKDRLDGYFKSFQLYIRKN